MLQQLISITSSLLYTLLFLSCCLSGQSILLCLYYRSQTTTGCWQCQAVIYARPLTDYYFFCAFVFTGLGLRVLDRNALTFDLDAAMAALRQQLLELASRKERVLRSHKSGIMGLAVSPSLYLRLNSLKKIK